MLDKGFSKQWFDLAPCSSTLQPALHFSSSILGSLHMKKALLAAMAALGQG